VYTTNNSRPEYSDPCGTEYTMYTMDDVELLNITRNVLPDRHDRNHASTVHGATQTKLTLRPE